MHLHHATLNDAFWAGGLSCDTALMIVLLGKRRARSFPAFTSLIGLNLVADLVLSPAIASSYRGFYLHTYWTYAAINVLIQAWIIYELASIVLKPTGTWVRDARANFLSWGAAGGLIALALAYLVSPPASTVLQRLGLRADLFTSLLICELVIVTTSASARLGLGWRNHVMAVGQAVTLWSATAVVIDSLHSYFGNGKSFASLEYVKFLAYLAATFYCCLQLWHEEPVRQPISPELRKYIVALHRRVQYDLGEAER